LYFSSIDFIMKVNFSEIYADLVDLTSELL